MTKSGRFSKFNNSYPEYGESVSNRGWTCMMPEITAESLQRAANDGQTLTGHFNCP